MAGILQSEYKNFSRQFVGSLLESEIRRLLFNYEGWNAIKGTVERSPKISERMKAIGNTPAILYLTPFAPHQVGTGAQVRSRQILRTLEQIGTVDVVVIEDERSEQSMGLGGDNREIANMLPVEVCRPKNSSIKSDGRVILKFCIRTAVA